LCRESSDMCRTAVGHIVDTATAVLKQTASS
jgi:hypothetical protein